MAKKLSAIHSIVAEVEGLNVAPGNDDLWVWGFCQAENLWFRNQLLFSRWSKIHLAAEWALVFHGWCKASGGLN